MNSGPASRRVHPSLRFSEIHSLSVLLFSALGSESSAPVVYEKNLEVSHLAAENGLRYMFRDEFAKPLRYCFPTIDAQGHHYLVSVLGNDHCSQARALTVL